MSFCYWYRCVDVVSCQVLLVGREGGGVVCGCWQSLGCRKTVLTVRQNFTLKCKISLKYKLDGNET